ncbi:hypothetical protein V5799_011225 [Amblyomma americanum]|uniref:Uncharacterized protein n=1 Tax=Amblyomma americanum TaxID=6943 RepID=A0AAQ4EHW4_AMBAM
MLEDLLQDTDDKDDLNHKQSCIGDGECDTAPDYLDVQQAGDELVHSGGDVGADAADDGFEVSGSVVAARHGSAVSCCCGDNRGFNSRDTQRDDMSGVMVATGGRFPCLHIGLTGLRASRRYFLALDFVEVGGASENGLSPYNYTEPYYAPRPNNLPGKQWMSGVLYFSLNSIANGRLQEGGTTLEVGGEYEPTLRLLELRDDQWPSGSSAMRFPLRGTAFLVVSLSSEVRTSRTALANEFLLVRRSEMTRSPCASQRQQQQPHEQHQPQDSFRKSPPSRGVFLEQSAASPTTLQQPDWRRLLELRAGSRQAATAAASRSLLAGSGESRSHGLQALPTAQELLSTSSGAVYSKPVVHDHFSGGVWKSLPAQPSAQLPHQHCHQHGHQHPVGAGAWHSSTARHNPLAPGAHMEMGAAPLQGMQHGREAFSSLLHQRQQRSISPQQPRSVPSNFANGARSGAGFQPAADHRPVLPPFGPTAAAAHALQECWTRSAPRTAATAAMMRLNYDLLPASYLQWLALAKNSMARPSTTAASAWTAALDHDQQPQHQPKQDLGVQTACFTTPPGEEEPEQDSGDTVRSSSASPVAPFSAPRPAMYYSSSPASTLSPP